jgi:P-type Cu+ transporter
MDVKPEDAAGKTEHEGQTYYFCSRGCKASFEKEPDKYLREAMPVHSHACC